MSLRHTVITDSHTKTAGCIKIGIDCTDFDAIQAEIEARIQQSSCEKKGSGFVLLIPMNVFFAFKIYKYLLSLSKQCEQNMISDNMGAMSVMLKNMQTCECFMDKFIEYFIQPAYQDSGQLVHKRTHDFFEMHPKLLDFKLDSNLLVTACLTADRIHCRHASACSSAVTGEVRSGDYKGIDVPCYHPHHYQSPQRRIRQGLPPLVKPTMQVLQTNSQVVHRHFQNIVAENTLEKHVYRNSAVVHHVMPAPHSSRDRVFENTDEDVSIAAHLDAIVHLIETMLHGKYRSIFHVQAATIEQVRTKYDLDETDIALLIYAIDNIQSRSRDLTLHGAV